MQEIAQRLKSLRESVNLSQAKLAALMGATQASVNRYENGQSSPPLKILQWYADFFDVSMDYIFARTDQPEGRLYEHKPKVLEAVTQENKELRQFVDMCFDPASPVSEKLREVLTKLLEEQSKKRVFPLANDILKSPPVKVKMNWLRQTLTNEDF